MRKKFRIRFMIVIVTICSIILIITVQKDLTSKAQNRSSNTIQNAVYLRKAEAQFVIVQDNNSALLRKAEAQSVIVRDNKSALLRQNHVQAASVIIPEIIANSSQNLAKPTAMTATGNLTDQWQTVDGVEKLVMVYSAYYDGRTQSKRRIVVIGTTTRSKPWPELYCLLRYNTTQEVPVAIGAKVVIIKENWNLEYSACYFECGLQRSAEIPSYVSIVGKSELAASTTSSNYLLVHNTSKQDGFPKKGNGKFCVCVKPFHYHFNRVNQLAEFVEMNRILGVEHFTFYNDTVGEDVDRLLRHYSAQGVAEILPWTLGKMKNQKAIRTENMFAAINDCMYRNMFLYEWHIFIDVDEYIFPHNNKHNSFADLIAQLLIPYESSFYYAAYCFRNSFFYLDWLNDFTAANQSVQLITQMKTTRTIKIWKRGNRSKCIIRGTDCMQMGNHAVWVMTNGKRAHTVDPSLGLLHHYRICEYGGNGCLTLPYVIDKTAHRWQDKLINRVKSVLN